MSAAPQAPVQIPTRILRDLRDASGIPQSELARRDRDERQRSVPT